ncbi:hypothetical protein NMG60_11012257 [Bertholletia excelsa]
MALIIPSSTWPLTKKPHPLLHCYLFHSSRIPSFFSSIKSQESSSSSSTEPPKSAAGDGSSSAVTRPPKTQPSAGEGFGSSSVKSNVNPAGTKKKQKGKRERASIIRRAPVEKPRFASSQQEEAQVKELASNESAFLLAWLGLGAIVLLEGIALAASGGTTIHICFRKMTIIWSLLEILEVIQTMDESHVQQLFSSYTHHPCSAVTHTTFSSYTHHIQQLYTHHGYMGLYST